ncbi:hypothetical protein [Halorubrum depositum]|uniref:hypothetical protein n=1 Tax=Halorubrum depositum TaxID=2583992 RepID=UPI0011A99781|nr:hypothetical protein [Halorubrum depositum]
MDVRKTLEKAQESSGVAPEWILLILRVVIVANRAVDVTVLLSTFLAPTFLIQLVSPVFHDEPAEITGSSKSHASRR